MGLTDKDRAKVQAAIIANKTLTYRFTKPAALEPIKNISTDKDVAKAKDLMKLTKIPQFEGLLPGYRETPGVVAAMACTFVENGKPVRMGKEPKVQP
jgi:hypothetical protein